MFGLKAFVWYIFHTMTPKLPSNMEKAVQKHHGWLQVNGAQSAYVVVSMEIFCDMMGVGNDQEMAASLKAIEEGRKDVAAGRTQSIITFFRAFDERHNIQG